MKKWFTIFSCFLYAQFGNCQDIHFAHIHASPILVNPSMAGLFNGDIRFIGNFRNQYSSVTANYTTFAASVDGPIARPGNSFVGGSISAFQDVAGDLNFSQKQVNMGLSFAKKLESDRTNYLALGVQGGLLENSVDFSEIHVFDHEAIANPLGGIGRMRTWDLSAGFVWWYRVPKNGLLYVGGSMHHINNPNVAIIGRRTGYAETLYRRRNLMAGAEIKANAQMTVLPSLLYMDQGPHKEILMGGFLRYNKTQLKSLAVFDNIYYGVWYRYYSEDKGYSGSDAVVTTLRMDKGFASFAISYDINLSTLTRASQGRGGPEASVILVLEKAKKVKPSSKAGNSGGNNCPAGEGKSPKSLDCPKF